MEQKWFLDTRFDKLPLILHSECQIFSSVTKLPHDNYVVVWCDFGLLLEPLNLVDNFSCESSDFELLALCQVD